VDTPKVICSGLISTVGIFDDFHRATISVAIRPRISKMIPFTHMFEKSRAVACLIRDPGCFALGFTSDDERKDAGAADFF
jgi:hypothetical protein